MEFREDRLIAPDGTAIWWAVLGVERGDPPLVLLDGIGCDGFIWRRLLPPWAERRRIVRLHLRGHGRSGVPRFYRHLSIRDLADDVARVLAAAGIDRAVVAGHSMGCQVALELHRRHPGRVAALLLLCGAPGRLLDTFHDGPYLKKVFPYAKEVVERFPGVARGLVAKVLPTDFAFRVATLLELDPRRARREDILPYLTHLGRMDPVVFVRMLDEASRHDASDHLPYVDVPALVVAGAEDRFTPVRLSVEMAERLPVAELLVLRRGSHAAPVEQPEPIRIRVEAFLRERGLSRGAGGGGPRLSAEVLDRAAAPTARAGTGPAEKRVRRTGAVRRPGAPGTADR